MSIVEETPEAANILPTPLREAYTVAATVDKAVDQEPAREVITVGLYAQWQ